VITLPNGRHVAIAVFVAEAHAPEAAAEKTIARLAQAAWQYWVRPAPGG
jgi:beta-lactamase class A